MREDILSHQSSKNSSAAHYRQYSSLGMASLSLYPTHPRKVYLWTHVVQHSRPTDIEMTVVMQTTSLKAFPATKKWGKHGLHLALQENACPKGLSEQTHTSPGCIFRDASKILFQDRTMNHLFSHLNKNHVNTIINQRGVARESNVWQSLLHNLGKENQTEGKSCMGETKAACRWWEERRRITGTQPPVPSCYHHPGAPTPIMGMADRLADWLPMEQVKGW